MGTEELDAYLDTVLIGGREPVDIVVVDHDPAWEARYAGVEAAVRAALGARVGVLEHVGSTSVPGLAAKPIVDVVLTIDDVEDEPAYVPALERAGLVLRVREPGHRMLRTPTRDVHLHVHAHGDPEVDRLLALRDHLRVDAADRDLYAASKRALAGRAWPDMNHYAVAKTEVIEQILSRAARGRAR